MRLLQFYILMRLAVTAAPQNRFAIFGDAQHPRAEAFGFGSGAAFHQYISLIFIHIRCKKMQICLTLYYYSAKIATQIKMLNLRR